MLGGGNTGVISRYNKLSFTPKFNDLFRCALIKLLQRARFFLVIVGVDIGSQEVIRNV